MNNKEKGSLPLPEILAINICDQIIRDKNTKNLTTKPPRLKEHQEKLK